MNSGRTKIDVDLDASCVLNRQHTVDCALTNGTSRNDRRKFLSVYWKIVSVGGAEKLIDELVNFTCREGIIRSRDRKGAVAQRIHALRTANEPAFHLSSNSSLHGNRSFLTNLMKRSRCADFEGRNTVELPL